MKPAFSTVACPDWTLARVADRAETWGYLGAELRTFGLASSEFACDPALTGVTKTRALFERAGVEMVSLATSLRFDAPVRPPVVGHLLDQERPLREAKAIIDLAIQLEVPFVRVFGFDFGSESRTSGLARVASRLFKVADYARNTGVKILIENGGSFNTGSELAELIDRVGHPLLQASYNIPVALMAGDDPEVAARMLGDRLSVVKVRDFRGQTPCALGDGSIDNKSALEALAKVGYNGWVVFEFDRAWFLRRNQAGAMSDVDAVLTTSAQRLFSWVGASALPRRTPAATIAAPAMAAR